MAGYYTEQEQIEQLKRFIKEYGWSIVIGIVLAFALGYGWQHWKQYRYQHRQEASIIYDTMMDSALQNQSEKKIVLAKQLKTQFKNTPYAVHAALMLAQEAAVTEKNMPKAIEELKWAFDHSKEKTIQQIIKIRIARLDIANGNPKEALHELDKVIDKNMLGLMNEIKGDAFSALGQIKEAQKAYQSALSQLPTAAMNRPILQMKLEDHGV